MHSSLAHLYAFLSLLLELSIPIMELARLCHDLKAVLCGILGMRLSSCCLSCTFSASNLFILLFLREVSCFKSSNFLFTFRISLIRVLINAVLSVWPVACVGTDVGVWVSVCVFERLCSCQCGCQ